MVNIKSKLHLRQKKERQTPEDRKKFGFIERHKDYKKRAENYHQNRKQQQQLIRAAEDRNPDEYTFEMERYQQGGLLNIKEIKDPLQHANDVIPQINLEHQIIKIDKEMNQLKVYLHNASTGLKNEDVQKEINQLLQKKVDIEQELKRRDIVKLKRSTKKVSDKYDDKLDKQVLKVKFERRK